MIIAGFTSYPWMPDWARFRADRRRGGRVPAGRYLAHRRHGGGRASSPARSGYAHVISFTTHKTLYGPRGACILTTDKALAAEDRLGRVPRRAGRPARERDRRHGGRVQAGADAGVPRSCSSRSSTTPRTWPPSWQRHGLRVPYGGTDTHMLLVDCKSVRAAAGQPRRRTGTPLMGDAAARILDLAGHRPQPQHDPGRQERRATPAASAWARRGSPSAASSSRRSSAWRRSSPGCSRPAGPTPAPGRAGRSTPPRSTSTCSSRPSGTSSTWPAASTWGRTTCPAATRTTSSCTSPPPIIGGDWT